MNRSMRLLRAVLAFVCLLGSGLVYAQTTTVTATKLKIGGYLIPTGQVTFTPVSTIGQPIAFADGTGAQNGPTAFAAQIVTGAITGSLTQTGSVGGIFTVPDATMTSPANILYRVQICDQSVGLRTSGMCYTLPQIVGVSGATWALDHYGPVNSTTNVQALQSTHGTATPTSCVEPSTFTNDATPSFSTCVGGVFVQFNTGPTGATGATGSAGTNGTPGAAATVAVGTINTLPAGTAATVANVGTASAAVLNFGIPQGAAGTGSSSGINPTPNAGVNQAIVQQNGTSFSVSGTGGGTTFGSFGKTNSMTVTGANFANGTAFTEQNNVGNCQFSGFDLGNNGTSAQGWSTCKMHYDNFSSGTAGIMQVYSGNFSHTAVGDTAYSYGYMQPFGGSVASSDESVSYSTMQTHQIGWFSAVVASGGTGATLLTTNLFTCHAYCSTQSSKGYAFADGGIALDTTTATSTAILGVAAPVMLNMHGYLLPTGTVPVSTAWGSIVSSSCTGNGNGQGGLYTSTTCNVTLGTSPASPGNFANGTNACLVGPFAEQVAITAAGAPSAGVQSITFNTRKAWNSGNAGIMQGGSCGQAMIATSTLNTQPIAYPIIGATNTTTVYFGNCLYGNCFGGGGNLLGVGTAVTFYPMAYIIGTNNGTSGANLATNTAPWVIGDAVVGAPTSEYLANSLRLVQGQNSPNTGSSMISMQDDGPVNVDRVLDINQNQGTATGSSTAVIYAVGSYLDYFHFPYRPRGSVIFVGNNEPNGGATVDYDLLYDGTSGAQIMVGVLENNFQFNKPVTTPGLIITTLTTPGVVTNTAAGALGTVAASTTVNGVSCILGGTCTIATGGTTIPKVQVTFTSPGSMVSGACITAGVTMSGVVITGIPTAITPSYPTDATGVAGWNPGGGMQVYVWPSAPNTATAKFCNGLPVAQTPANYTFTLAAQ